MVNITISQSGKVTGDKGKIVAYNNQRYSEPIRIVHPIFSGALYYIQYRYNQTIFTDQLDANGIVKLKIEHCGYLSCQFIARDVCTGNPIFTSSTWNFLVGDTLKTEPCHYPCPPDYISSGGHHHFNGCCPPPPPPSDPYRDNFDSYDAYWKLKNELRNEEEIRFNETQSLMTEIEQIKDYINMSDPVPSKLDANELLEAGTYMANAESINFPAENQEYKVTVSNYGNNHSVLQNAAEVDSDNVWFRTGEYNDMTGEYDWTTWTPLITRVSEI